MHLQSAYNRSFYKVVEISTVTDETLEEAVNIWTSKGWIFDQVQFVVRDSSRRPSMAFVFFTKPFHPETQLEQSGVQRSETTQNRTGTETIEGDLNEIDLS